MDLSALSSFFEVLWTEVMAGLTADDHAFLCVAAGECLNALGRVLEAEAPLKRSTALACEHRNWTMATRAATTLSEVYRASGQLTNALTAAEQSATHANCCGVSTKVQLSSYAFLGFILHWVGQTEQSATVFQRVEQLQQHAHPDRPILHAVQGYMYCELLLDRLRSQLHALSCDQFQQAWTHLYARIEQALHFAIEDEIPCDIGLQNVSMGRVYLLAWEYDRQTNHTESVNEADPAQYLDRALVHLDDALEYLRRSNHRNYLPRGLLTRALLHRCRGAVELAHIDIDAVLDIALSSDMDFYRADACLERAHIYSHLYATTGQETERRHAVSYLNQAKALIRDMGYHRRDREVVELETRIRQVDQDRPESPGALG